MKDTFAPVKSAARRLALLSLWPSLTVCSGAAATGTTPNPPGTVSDLSVSSTSTASAALAFTQVDDGTGQPAKYDVRYAIAPIQWGSASSSAMGTCATPLAGTAVGTSLFCTILGLAPSTSYNFQIIAFRGALNVDATFGNPSNVAVGSTSALPPPTPVVTTVTVLPSSALVAAGSSVALTATVRDQQGNAMTGQSVTWSTNNAGGVTVSASGVVTGVAAGTATVTATSSGKTGTSNITVTSPPPPPPPGGTLLFQENFEDSNLAARGWYDNTSTLLSTAEHVANSNSSAQYHYLVGAQQPTTGGSQRHKFTPTTSLYISYYVKYSANWVGSNQTYHPHEFYAMSNLDGDYDGPANAYMTVYMEQNYQNGGKPALYIQDNKSINTGSGSLPNNLVGTTENRSTSGCNGISETVPWSVVSCYNAPPWYNAKGMIGPVTFQPNPGTGYKNNWNFVEAYYQLNTISNGVGQPDGVLQYWFNGTLIIDRHDVVYRTSTHPTLMFSQFLIAPYIGDGSPVDQSMFIDNLRAATARIP
ncbi:MAG TPA: Ig-like domain-containing protein [Gemmatimonadaceae bacterium]|nr:Ig-like domain-containing protein [Gemmatimonadaceae bacterium]